MRSFFKKSWVVSLAVLVLAALFSQSVSPYIGNIQAAAPVSKTVTALDGSTTECTAELNLEAFGFIGNDPVSADMMAQYDTLSASLKSDLDALEIKMGNNEKIFFVKFLAVNKTTQNSDTCERFGTMFARPSKPTEFIGYSYVSKGLLFATLNATNKTLTYTSPNGSTTYNISANPNAGDVFGNPSFNGGGSVGFCSAEQAVGGAVYQSCMTARVVNFTTITYRGETYTLNQWRGDDMEYYLSSTPYPAREFFKTQAIGQCRPRIQFGTGNSDQSDGDQFDLNVDEDSTTELREALDAFAKLPATANFGYQDYETNCTAKSQVTIPVTNVTNLRLIFQVFPKEKKIVFLASNPKGNELKFVTGPFVQDATNPLKYVAPPRSETCASDIVTPYILLKSAPSEASSSPNLEADWFFQTDSKNCEDLTVVKSSMIVKQTPGNSTETSTSVGQQSQAEQQAAQAQDGEVPITCNTTWKSPISWFLCPVINVAEDLVGIIEDVVQNFLFVDISKFNGNLAGNNNGEGMYTAWNALRQIATVIIVIIALLMIFSEAMGQSVMSNYSVKKLLPRLLFAGIAIQLSWIFTKELINISNVFGDGIGNLLLAPFGGREGTSLLRLIDPKELSAGAGTGFFFATVVGGAVAIGAVGSIAIGLIIAIVIAFVTLILRYMVIILCVMVAPVAIALAVLPGTQKFSKLWWESLTKALMMYPVIMAMFAAGKIVAFGLMQAAQNPDGSQDGWFTLGAIIAFFLPYGLLPAALKAGGTALNKVTGAFNDRSKGIFDSMRKGGQQFKDKRKGWAGSKYVPGGSKLQNAAARIGSGSFTKRQALQKGTQYYSGELKKAQELLVGINRNPNREQRTQQLVKLAQSSTNQIGAQAAMEQLLKTGEVGELRKMIQEGSVNSKALVMFRNTSFSDIKNKAVDLAMDFDTRTEEGKAKLGVELSKLSPEAFASQHKSTLEQVLNDNKDAARNMVGKTYETGKVLPDGTKETKSFTSGDMDRLRDVAGRAVSDDRIRNAVGAEMVDVLETINHGPYAGAGTGGPGPTTPPPTSGGGTPTGTAGGGGMPGGPGFGVGP